jgi:hypothetical protein
MLANEERSRYIIGIDLGTTNVCVAYVDTNTEKKSYGRIDQLMIPQMVEAGFWNEKSTLPSFYYALSNEESSRQEFQEPWSSGKRYIVGEYAKKLGSQSSSRLVSSAKSWLCHPSAALQDRFLPLQSLDDIEKASPVEVSAAYLQHIKEAWDVTIARGDPLKEFCQQEIIITLPASFNEIARQLTIEAANLAQYPKLTLLEEPQAAFYYWMSRNNSLFGTFFEDKNSILICDVGGGTTDFSWLQVSKKDEKIDFQRMAVGRHMLVGGDNMDVAIAHHLEKLFFDETGSEISSQQWHEMLCSARTIKEDVFDENCSKDTFRVVLQGTGSSLVGGSVQIDVKTKSIRSLILDGFFGEYTLEEAINIQRSSALRHEGLAYESEPSLIKHIASFLKVVGKGTPIAPDYVLFNGGAMKPEEFREEILNSLDRWFDKRPKTLDNKNLDLSVSKGAAHYGKVRRGEEQRILGGIPRTYYLGVAVEGKEGSYGVVVMQRGAEEGSSFSPEQIFTLKPNQRVAFTLYASQTRLDDKLGEIVSINEQEFTALPKIETFLRYGKVNSPQDINIPGRLCAKLTELGTLDLSLQSINTQHDWQLEFQLRGSQGEENTLTSSPSKIEDETLTQDQMLKHKEVLRTFFLEFTQDPQDLIKKLEESLEIAKKDWPLSVLRSLFDELMPYVKEKDRSYRHESRWWNLAGYCLRPGFGYPLDEHRVKALWSVVLCDNPFENQLDTEIQRLICYRRVAGGLSRGQQLQLSSKILSRIFDKKKKKFILNSKKNNYFFEQNLRALAALEFLDISLKKDLGNALVSLILSGEVSHGECWALARLGARHLLYGGISYVVPPSVCEKWLKDLCSIDNLPRNFKFMLTMMLKRSEHREHNISSEVKKMVEDSFFSEGLSSTLDSQEYSFEQQKEILGDEIPCGLTLSL